MRYGLHFAHYKLLHIVGPGLYKGHFTQNQFHLQTIQIFLCRKKIKLKVLLDFENFQIVKH